MTLQSVLTTDEAANRLGLAKRTVQAYCKAGLIVATKFGRDWVVTIEAVEAFEAQRSSSEEAAPQQ